MHDEGEPERQAAGAPREMEGEVGRVDVLVPERLEVRRVLTVGAAGRGGVPIEHGSAIER